MFRWCDAYRQYRDKVEPEQRAIMEKYIDKWHEIMEEGVMLMVDADLLPDSPARQEFSEAYRQFEDILDNGRLNWTDSEFEIHAKTRRLEKQLELLKRLFLKAQAQA